MGPSHVLTPSENEVGMWNKTEIKIKCHDQKFNGKCIKTFTFDFSNPGHHPGFKAEKSRTYKANICDLITANVQEIFSTHFAKAELQTVTTDLKFETKSLV